MIHEYPVDTYTLAQYLKNLIPHTSTPPSSCTTYSQDNGLVPPCPDKPSFLLSFRPSPSPVPAKVPLATPQWLQPVPLELTALPLLSAVLLLPAARTTTTTTTCTATAASSIIAAPILVACRGTTSVCVCLRNTGRCWHTPIAFLVLVTLWWWRVWKAQVRTAGDPGTHATLLLLVLVAVATGRLQDHLADTPRLDHVLGDTSAAGKEPLFVSIGAV